MQDEILKRLDALAEQMGIATGHLWEVMVRQATISGIVDMAWALVLIFVVIVGWKIGKWGVSGNDGKGSEPATVLGGLMLTIGSISFAMSLTYGIQELLNPEFYALKNILDVLGK